MGERKNTPLPPRSELHTGHSISDQAPCLVFFQREILDHNNITYNKTLFVAMGIAMGGIAPPNFSERRGYAPAHFIKQHRLKIKYSIATTLFMIILIRSISAFNLSKLLVLDS